MRGNASALFRASFGVAPRAAASAPGRVNLIGEHTDYNGGPVLPVACAARTFVAVGPAEAGVLEMVSTHDGHVTLTDYREGRPAGWGAYLAGVMHELVALGAAPLEGGARIAVTSNVPAPRASHRLPRSRWPRPKRSACSEARVSRHASWQAWRFVPSTITSACAAALWIR